MDPAAETGAQSKVKPALPPPSLRKPASGAAASAAAAADPGKKVEFSEVQVEIVAKAEVSGNEKLAQGHGADSDTLTSLKGAGPETGAAARVQNLDPVFPGRAPQPGVNHAAKQLPEVTLFESVCL